MFDDRRVVWRDCFRKHEGDGDIPKKLGFTQRVCVWKLGFHSPGRALVMINRRGMGIYMYIILFQIDFKDGECICCNAFGSVIDSIVDLMQAIMSHPQFYQIWLAQILRQLEGYCCVYHIAVSTHIYDCIDTAQIGI